MARKFTFGSVQSAGVCPLCKSPMRERIARRGPNRGRRFLGCARWPQCSHVVDAAAQQWSPPIDAEDVRLEGRGFDPDEGTEGDLCDPNAGLGLFPERDDWGW
jgi:ssDNA-binding Zn-finger/Zn-ribbon topoisomerase 1